MVDVMHEKDVHKQQQTSLIAIKVFYIFTSVPVLLESTVKCTSQKWYMFWLLTFSPKKIKLSFDDKHQPRPRKSYRHRMNT